MSELKLMAVYEQISSLAPNPCIELAREETRVLSPARAPVFASAYTD